MVELAVVLAVLSVLLYFLLDRVLYVQELAERTEVEETVRSINYALRLEAASRLARGAERGRLPLDRENPVKWLQSPPRNYLGEYEEPPGQAKPGYWYYRPTDRQLIYRPNRSEHLSVGAGGNKDIAFGVQPHGGEISQPMLVPRSRYRWFEEAYGEKR